MTRGARRGSERNERDAGRWGRQERGGGGWQREEREELGKEALAQGGRSTSIRSMRISRFRDRSSCQARKAGDGRWVARGWPGASGQGLFAKSPPVCVSQSCPGKPSVCVPVRGLCTAFPRAANEAYKRNRCLGANPRSAQSDRTRF